MKNELSLRQYTVASPSRIADKVMVFRAFYRMGERAMDKLVQLRDKYERKYTGAMELVDKICKEQDVSAKVAQAYLQMRRLITAAYHMINEARRHPLTCAIRAADAIQIVDEKSLDDGSATFSSPARPSATQSNSPNSGRKRTRSRTANRFTSTRAASMRTSHSTRRDKPEFKTKAFRLFITPAYGNRGVLNDIGLDTSTGYDRNRASLFGGAGILGKIDNLGNKSMWLFQKLGSLCRASSALVAYEKAVAEGKSRAQALDYAKKVNLDAIAGSQEVFGAYSELGRKVAQSLMYGAVTNVDVSKRAGMASIMPRDLQSFLLGAAGYDAWGRAVRLMGFKSVDESFAADIADPSPENRKRLQQTVPKKLRKDYEYLFKFAQ